MDHPTYHTSTKLHLHLFVGLGRKIGKKKKKSNQFKSYYPASIIYSYSVLTNTPMAFLPNALSGTTSSHIIFLPVT